MEALGNLIVKIYTDFGLILTLLIILLAVGIYELIKCGGAYLMTLIQARTNIPFLNRRRSRLVRHVVFSKLDTLLNYRIKNMHIACMLRNKIFTDLLTIRITTVRDTLKDFSKAEIDGLSQADFRQTVADRLQAIMFGWSTKALAEGIPASAVDKFKEQNERWAHILDEVILDQCLVTTTYQTNTERLDTIFDMIGSFEIHVFSDVEKTLCLLNGEISSVTYKGIACNECTPGCIMAPKKKQEKE